MQRAVDQYLLIASMIYCDVDLVEKYLPRYIGPK